MKVQRYGRIAGVTLAGALALAACGSNNNSTTTPSSSGSASSSGNGIGVPCATGTVNASGSTAQANAISQWTKTYTAACSGAVLNYNANGSGAGISQFTAGSTAFAGSDSPLKPATEMPAASKRCTGGQAVDLPMVVGPIAVIYNVQGVSDLQLSPATLAGIFAGKIKTWSDPTIKKDNPSASSLPSTPIQTFHRSDSSGTSQNFTAFLAAAAPSVWTYTPAKTWSAPGGQGAKGSNLVAQNVKSTPGAIGYAEYSYALNDQLSTAKIQNGSGQYVALSTQSAAAGVATASVVGTAPDLSLKINYKPTDPTAYPIVLVTYEITCTKGLPATQAALVKSLLSYTASTNGQNVLSSLGYAPLPSSLEQKVVADIQSLS